MINTTPFQFVKKIKKKNVRSTTTTSLTYFIKKCKLIDILMKLRVTIKENTFLFANKELEKKLSPEDKTAKLIDKLPKDLIKLFFWGLTVIY